MEANRVNPTSEDAAISLSGPTAYDANHWRPEDLEELRACPICCSSERSFLHQGIMDRVFFSSADSWNLWRCRNCECAYLSPRPKQSSIGRAYSSYYTHLVSAPDTAGPLRLAYRNLRHLYELGQRGEAESEPVAHRLAAYCMGLVLHRRWELRARMYPRRTGERLLDVGCGSGDYLEVAASVGWKAEGIDPDPRAVGLAKARGLEVRLSDLESEAKRSAGTYDAITMLHVIEHFHDPMAALRACHSLLQPGGRIWIATPRLESAGHKRFGEDWRGLEVPRHLVLFNEKSLSLALRKASFDCLAVERAGYHAMFYWLQSYAIRKRKNPYLEPASLPARLKLAAWYENLGASFSAHVGEQINLSAKRG